MILSQEPISSGCYCISSIYDDASFDLITKQNGVIYDPKKNNSLLSILQRIIDKPYLIQKNLININLKRFSTNSYSSIFSSCIIDNFHE